jgi:cytochrome c oxidase assembly factor CtaG
LVLVAGWRAVRLWLGIVLAVLCAWLAWHVGNERFRFVWMGDEGEFLVFVVVLGLLAAVLIATGIQPPRSAGDARSGAGRWLVRGAAYLCACVALMLVALWAGTAYYDTTDCPTSDADCLSLLGGMVWAVIAVPVTAVVVVVIELVLRRRRKERRTSADLGG